MFGKKKHSSTSLESTGASFHTKRPPSILLPHLRDCSTSKRSGTLEDWLLAVSVAWLSLLPLVGCFSQRAIPMKPGDIVHIQTAGLTSSSPRPADTRHWLQDAHTQLKTLLPGLAKSALLTEDLADSDGKPVDVFQHFGIDPAHLQLLLFNWMGLSHTAQACGTGVTIETPAPPWPGFADTWIPIHDNLKLGGRIGYAQRHGERIEADCIVILGGLYGDNGTYRTRDLAMALRREGFHVLALELRGAGQTEASYPSVAYSFGVQETHDLMTVSTWLEVQPCVRHTGLIGFCWGGNAALLTAWYDGAAQDDADVRPELAKLMPARSGRNHFRAGVIAFSPVLAFEEMIELLETDRDSVREPVWAGLQANVRCRAERKGYDDVEGRLGKLIAREYAAQPRDYPNHVPDGLRFLRLLPHPSEPVGNKLANARVPVLIVYGANDPLSPAQDVAQLLATTDNPNVAALVLPGGGHVGFAPFARRYYFSLIYNFFDPRR